MRDVLIVVRYVQSLYHAYIRLATRPQGSGQLQSICSCNRLVPVMLIAYIHIYSLFSPFAAIMDSHCSYNHVVNFALLVGTPPLGDAFGLLFVPLLHTSTGPIPSTSSPTTTPGELPSVTISGVPPSTSAPALTARFLDPLSSGPSPYFGFPGTPIPIYPSIQLPPSLKYVDMKDLLPDNIAAAEQFSQGGQSPHKHSPRQREITSILTWVSAFITYTGIVAEAHPTCIKDLLAYQRLIVREAKRGNKSWISYDHIFHQNAVANPALHWDSLDPSLHSSFCIGNEPPPTMCSHCNELDHRSDKCALAKPSPQDKDKPGKPTHYLDDFILFSRPSLDECLCSLQITHSCCTEL